MGSPPHTLDPAPTSSPGSSSPTILVVDDEPEILELLQEMLQDEGYTVLTAVNGLVALELLAQTRVAIVLTDYMMPRMNGIELCTRLRADPRTATMPIVLMSAAPPRDAADMFTLVIQKPFTIDDILKQIQHYSS
jgi:two-component system, OmpR family, response regulator VicR